MSSNLFKGKIVLRGVATEANTEAAIKWGLDDVIISNHGERQLDAGACPKTANQKLLQPIAIK